MDTPTKKVGIVGGRSTGKMAILAAAAGLVLAGATGPALQRPMLRPEAPKIESPRAASRTKRQSRKVIERQNRKARQRQEAAARHRYGEKRRGLFLMKQDSKDLEIQSAINRMTNWQRKQWARAGYPRDLKSVKHFAGLIRVTPQMQLAAALFGYSTIQTGASHDNRENG